MIDVYLLAQSSFWKSDLWSSYITIILKNALVSVTINTSVTNLKEQIIFLNGNERSDFLAL